MPEKTKKIRRLKNLKLRRVDMVPKGASQGANISLIKIDEEEEEMGKTEQAIAKSADRTLTLEKRRKAYQAERAAEDAPRIPKRPDPSGEFLKRKREETGRTQADVAKSADLPTSTYNDMECGSRPSWSAFSNACSALEVTTDELIAAGFLRGP